MYVRWCEAVQDNRGMSNGSKSNPITVDAMKGRSKHPNSKPPSFKKPATPTHNYHKGDSYKQCTRHGKGSHKRDKCPVRDATCHKCHKKGHYSASKVDTVTTKTESMHNTDLSEE